MKLSLIKNNGAFFPVGETSLLAMTKLPNLEYVIDFKQYRNPRFHRKAFSLLKTVFDNQDGFTNFDLFRSWITMKCGYVITGHAPNGTTVFMAESLKFESMSAERFECWYQAIIGVAIAEYGLNEDLLNKVLSYA